MMEIAMIANLPEDIITEILLRLPVKSLVRFKCVSKQWLFLISSSKFAMGHFEISANNTVYIKDKIIFGSRNLPLELYTCSIQSIIDGSDNVLQFYLIPTNGNLQFDRVVFESDRFVWPDDVAGLERPASVVPNAEVRLLGSCNGLVCFSVSNFIVLANPATGIWKLLPHSGTNDSEFQHYHFSYSFGYDEVRGDYKVVEVISLEDQTNEYKTIVKVYSMRTKSWKTLLNWPAGEIWFQGKCVNGSIHWAVRGFLGVTNWVIVSLDLATDTFGPLLLLKDLDQNDALVWCEILGSCLGVCVKHSYEMDIWLMKEYGVRESWTQVMRVPFIPEPNRHSIPHPLFLSVDGKILIKHGESLKIYDSSNPRPHGYDNHTVVDVITYVESLFSLTLDEEEEERNNP